MLLFHAASWILLGRGGVSGSVCEGQRGSPETAPSQGVRSAKLKTAFTLHSS